MKQEERNETLDDALIPTVMASLFLQQSKSGCQSTATQREVAARAVECCNQSQCPAAEGKSPSGSPPSKGSLFTREFLIFHHEPGLQPRSAWGSLWEPKEHGVHRLPNGISHRCPSLQPKHVSNQQPRLRPSYTSDEASLATDLLLLCHRGHLPPPSGHWDREQNLPGFFCSIQVHCGDSLQGPTDPEQQRASSLLSVSESIPNCYVPHQKCLPTAEPVHPGSLLYPASVRGTASRYPSHHRGSAQQHPFGHLPGPRGCAPDQRRGHGDGRWHHHGHVSRNLVDHPTTHRHRSTSSFCANVPGSRDPHLQLRTAALVNPLAKSYPKSNIVCNYTSLTSGLRPLDCSTSSVCKNKRKKCKGHFMHSLVVFVKAAFSNLLPLYFPSLLPLPDPHQSCNTY
ncbi:protein FAM168A isoform X3 [Gallus gallus]|uniref:protein FAM168A isoform X3 n=1 Tax=Gallus gallus TaxID=9031 RepID=UPI001AEB9335|nr:protein FAM168A isoform X3 [Gallus gallus]XP_046765361.1 protein FAM168A isoform X3 [Gallus gallus]XP_046765362.1 protein FAM168A isoform X3 [Gallus gallus]